MIANHAKQKLGITEDDLCDMKMLLPRVYLKGSGVNQCVMTYD